MCRRRAPARICRDRLSISTIMRLSSPTPPVIRIMTASRFHQAVQGGADRQRGDQRGHAQRDRGQQQGGLERRTPQTGRRCAQRPHRCRRHHSQDRLGRRVNDLTLRRSASRWITNRASEGARRLPRRPFSVDAAHAPIVARSRSRVSGLCLRSASADRQRRVSAIWKREIRKWLICRAAPPRYRYAMTLTDFESEVKEV